MTSCLSLSQVFLPDYDFAWRLLDAQCLIHTSKDITKDEVAKLSQMYMKAIEKLNSIQDQRQKYFYNKWQKLMAKPDVIRCFENKNQGKKNYIRKQMQQKLAQQTDKSHPQRLKQLINQYQQKQKKKIQKIDKIILEQQKNLQLRKSKRANKCNKLGDSSSLQSSGRKEYFSTIENFHLTTTSFNPQNSIGTKSSQTQIYQVQSP